MIGTMEYWIPTLGLERLIHLMMDLKVALHPILKDGEVFSFTLIVGGVLNSTLGLKIAWSQIGSKGSMYLYSYMIYLSSWRFSHAYPPMFL